MEWRRGAGVVFSSQQSSRSKVADTTPPDPDAGLVDAALGDPSRFVALYERYADRVYRYALNRTGSPEQAADIVSETMLAALESLDRYDPSRGGFAAWLFAIARNKVIDEQRLHRRFWRAITRRPAGETVQDGGLDDLLTFDEAGAVRFALGHLSARDREVVLLRYSAELSSQEIGALLGISPEAARKRLSRALRRLAIQMGVDEDG